MIFNYRHFLDKDWERQTAFEILSNLLATHESYTEEETRRHYDFKGLPQEDPDKFEATIWTEVGQTLLKRVFEVTWMDADNEERNFVMERMEWRDR